MSRKLPIFYSALLLTAVNLLLRFAGTGFQVYLSRRIGAAGVGLLQLTMSVGSLAMVAGIAGVRTAAMYLTAEELGKGRSEHVHWVLAGCFRYSILCSGIIAATLYLAAPWVARYWIGDLRVQGALRLVCAFLPATCLCAVMTGYFTAAGRIGTLAAVEVAEQLCSMTVTVAALTLWAGSDPGRACISVVLGSSISSCLTLLTLVFLRVREQSPVSDPVPMAKRLASAAIPLALADVLRSGISTTENLMVPKRLTKYPGTSDPLAEFGMVSGMVFPVLMFPACILFGLTELLIPELSRCNASGSGARIRYLVRRSLRLAALYGCLFGGLEFLLSRSLCIRLYDSPEAGKQLSLYALMIPMLYCDAITDAMTKGLGQQKICVFYNILTNAMDVALLFLLLPRYGMAGYFVSFFFTHLLNFLLSLRRLLKITGMGIGIYIPILMGFSVVFSLWCCRYLSSPLLRCMAYPLLLGSLLYFLKIISQEDLSWLRGLLRKEKRPA